MSAPASRLAALFALMTMFLCLGCGSRQASYKTVSAEKGVVSLPLSEVKDGKVHFFTYRGSGKRVNFLIRTDGKGQLSAAFDACFTCFRHKKGYRVEGADLVCNECGMHFALAEEKWEKNKECRPIPIKSSVVADRFIISSADLEKGERLFR